MTGPNDLISALRQKREEESMSSTSPNVKYKESDKNPMTMQDYWEKIKEMDEKLDRILEHIGSEREGTNGTGNSGTGKY